MSSNNEIILRIIDDFFKIIEKILEDKGTEEALNQIKRVDKVGVEEHYKPKLVNERELDGINASLVLSSSNIFSMIFKKKNQETLQGKLDNNDIKTLKELLEF